MGAAGNSAGGGCVAACGDRGGPFGGAGAYGRGGALSGIAARRAPAHDGLLYRAGGL